jgi:SAM-dependent methyltransferase
VTAAGFCSDLDFDLPVRDQLALRTVPGAVDYLFEDLRQLTGARVNVVHRYRNALLVSYDGPLRPLAGVRYFDVCSVPLGDEPELRLAQSRVDGVLSALATAGAEVRFRIGDIGDERWPLRERLEARSGWLNRADAWDVNIERSSLGGDGSELVAEIGPLYLTQRYGELERMPASTNPLIAAVMVRLAKLSAGDAVLDPFCGAGTLLVLAGESAEAVDLVGVDLNRSWLAKSRHNLSSRRLGGALVNADAGRLPIADASIDRVVSNLPFGKRIGSHHVNTELYPRALREIARVLHGQGRAVLLTDDKRLFKETVQRTPLVRVVKEIMLEQHGGLHPTAYVLTKGRGSRRRS